MAERAFADDSPGRTSLWVGAGLTAAAALLFPKIESIKNDDEPAWHLLIFFWPDDAEGIVLIPLVVALAVFLFWLVGGWAWRSQTGNRPAKVGLVCGVLGLLGVLVFFVSAPIILGGLALTLGLEGRRRSRQQGGHGRAVAATTLGSVSFAVGAGIWIFG